MGIRLGLGAGGLAKAAASKDLLAGEPAGVIRGQEDSDSGDIAGLTDAAQFWTSPYSHASFFRSSPTVFNISRESASSDTARESPIAPTSALRVKIAPDLAGPSSLAGGQIGDQLEGV